MKKILAIYKPHMLRPILSRVLYRALACLILLLLWDRFLNRSGALQLVRDGGTAAALLFFALAWFSYLKLDGLRLIFRTEEERKKKPQRRIPSGSVMDFVDQHITPADDLSDEERTACSLAANLLCGLIFLLPALVMLL